MPIVFNGDGTVTGITTGGLPDGVIDTDSLAANAVTFAKIGTTEQGQLCKAWVNFNGTGAVAIRASYNVSSITDHGTGDYTVTFTTALADANYSVCLTSSVQGTTTTNGGAISTLSRNATPGTSSVRFETSSISALADTLNANVAIFR